MRYEFRELSIEKVCALVFQKGGKASAKGNRVSVLVTLMLPCQVSGYGLDASLLFENASPEIFGGKLDDDAWGELDGAADMSYRSRTKTFWGTTYLEALRRAKDYADAEVSYLRQMLRLRDGGRKPTEYELAEQVVLPSCVPSSQYFEIWGHRNESWNQCAACPDMAYAA